MDKELNKKVKKIVEKFIDDYKSELRDIIENEDTVKSYIFSYLIEKLEKKNKYVISTEFGIGDYQRHDITILNKEDYEKLNDSKDCKKLIVIELKHYLSFTQENKKRFEHDINKFKKCNKDTYKIFISLDCNKEFEEIYKEKFEECTNLNIFI